MTTFAGTAGDPASVARLDARRTPGAGQAATDRTDAQRMERMIDAVQNLSRQLAETQQLLGTFAQQLSAAAADLAADREVPAAPVRAARPAVAAPARAARPAVGVPVRRAAPPAPVDPTARPVPPSPLAGFVRAPGEEPRTDPGPR